MAVLNTQPNWDFVFYFTRKSIFKKSGFKSYIYISDYTNYWTEYLENDII